MANDPNTVDQISDQDLFRQAIAEPSAPQETPEQAPSPTPAPTPEPIQPTPEAAIPSWRLREEAEARRLAEDRARQLEARLQQIETHQRQNPTKPPDFFENPDAATQGVIARVLQPFVEQLQREREQDRRERIYLGKSIAENVHGADRVNEAEQAFLSARADQSLDPMDYERVVQAPNRYDEVVRWHQRQSMIATVGNDPNAWFEKQLEAKMADPKFQAQLMEKVRGSAAGRPTETRLPPSLSKATAAANNRTEDLDMSDKGLFDFAMRQGRH